MCGVAGFVDPRQRLADSQSLIRRMAGTLEHRGPDDAGEWRDAEAGIALGHRRLSILDLTAAGHQPMLSHCGRYVLAYNGEVYNHLAIRADMQRHAPTDDIRFRGHSDTETLVNAIALWGVADTLQRCNGMFAFALWDREERKLTLGRDRAGKKPLYYSLYRGSLLFSSEMRALFAGMQQRPEIDRGALTLFLRHNHVPGPYSIYHGVQKLPAGTLLEIQLSDIAAGNIPVPVTWWSAEREARKAQGSGYAGTLTDAIDELDGLLRDATRLRMLSDVPLGVFLSGGIDSSLVTAAMQAESAVPVRSFSIGFEDETFNEAAFASRVAEHLGTDHAELYVSERHLLDAVPQMAGIYDEPFADASQIPSWLVSRMARQDVTVALSGDGGDELFGGYERYWFGEQRWQRMRRLPLPLRRMGNALVQGCPDVLLNALLGLAKQESADGRADIASRLKMRAAMAASGSAAALHQALVSDSLHPRHLVQGGNEPSYALNPAAAIDGIQGVAEQMMLLDYIEWLPDDLLVKMDRASMAVSLEVRAPLLDYRLFEFAWRLPREFRTEDGVQGKRILRELLSRYLPQELFDRPKQGFCVPVASWLRGPLRDWSEALLDPRRLQDEGWLDARCVRLCWDQHLAGSHDWGDLLWSILMFQSWQDRWTANSLS